MTTSAPAPSSTSILSSLVLRLPWYKNNFHWVCLCHWNFSSKIPKMTTKRKFCFVLYIIWYVFKLKCFLILAPVFWLLGCLVNIKPTVLLYGLMTRSNYNQLVVINHGHKLMTPCILNIDFSLQIFCIFMFCFCMCICQMYFYVQTKK